MKTIHETFVDGVWPQEKTGSLASLKKCCPPKSPGKDAVHTDAYIHTHRCIYLHTKNTYIYMYKIIETKIRKRQLI